MLGLYFTKVLIDCRIVYQILAKGDDKIFETNINDTPSSQEMSVLNFVKKITYQHDILYIYSNFFRMSPIIRVLFGLLREKSFNHLILKFGNNADIPIYSIIYDGSTIKCLTYIGDTITQKNLEFISNCHTLYDIHLQLLTPPRQWPSFKKINHLKKFRMAFNSDRFEIGEKIMQDLAGMDLRRIVLDFELNMSDSKIITFFESFDGLDEIEVNVKNLVVLDHLTKLFLSKYNTTTVNIYSESITEKYFLYYMSYLYDLFFNEDRTAFFVSAVGITLPFNSQDEKYAPKYIGMTNFVDSRTVWMKNCDQRAIAVLFLKEYLMDGVLMSMSTFLA